MQVFLSPSTQYWNLYATGGDEREFMNIIADKMIPYLNASGICFSRNDPMQNFRAAVEASNRGNYDVHLALHSNAAPEQLAGQLRGIDVYYYPHSSESRRLAEIIAENLKKIYPLPEMVRIMPTNTLSEVVNTRAVSVMPEIGYHDNMEDVTWLKANTGQIARNLVQSLTEYFGVSFIEYIPPRTATVTTRSGTRLNMRSAPSIYAPIVTSLPSGATVTVYGENNGWYSVLWGNSRGFAFSEYIST